MNKSDLNEMIKGNGDIHQWSIKRNENIKKY